MYHAMIPTFVPMILVTPKMDVYSPISCDDSNMCTMIVVKLKLVCRHSAEYWHTGSDCVTDCCDPEVCCETAVSIVMIIILVPMIAAMALKVVNSILMFLMTAMLVLMIPASTVGCINTLFPAMTIMLVLLTDVIPLQVVLMKILSAKMKMSVS